MTAEVALPVRDIIITAGRKVDEGVVDVKENVCLDTLKIHAVPRIQYLLSGTDGLHKVREEFDMENECILITTPVQWLLNTHTIRERRQNREIAV